jgi:hypothetical protein
VVAEALERLLEVRRVPRPHVEHRARLAGDGVGRLDLRVPLDRLAHLGGGHATLRVQRHERVRPPAEAARVDLGGVAADDAVGLEPVDAPLDRRSRQRDPHSDALEGPAGVLPEQRNDLTVDIVHTAMSIACHAMNRA